MGASVAKGWLDFRHREMAVRREGGHREEMTKSQFWKAVGAVWVVMLVAGGVMHRAAAAASPAGTLP